MIVSKVQEIRQNGKAEDYEFLDNIIFKAVIVILGVEILQQILKYCGKSIVNWIEECNGKRINIKCTLGEIISVQKKLLREHILGIGTDLEQTSLSFVTIAMLVPCSMVISAYGNIISDIGEGGEKHSFIFFIASMIMIFNNETVLDRKRGGMVSAYSSIICVVIVWIISIFILSIRGLKILSPPLDLVDCKLLNGVRRKVVVEHNFFLLRYCSLFYLAGVIKKPIYTNRKTQLLNTSLRVLWLTMIFLSFNLSRTELNYFFKDPKNPREITYVLYLTLCEWDGRIFIYFLFLQAIILQHALVQVDPLACEAIYLCNIQRGFSEEELRAAPLLSPMKWWFWKGPSSAIISLVQEMREKFITLLEEKENYIKETRIFSPFGVYEEISNEFLHYNIKRLNIIFWLIKKNYSQDEVIYRACFRQKNVISLKDKLKEFNKYISKCLETTVTNRKNGNFEKCSNALSKQIEIVFNSGKESKITRTGFCFRADIFYSVLNDSNAYIDWFFLDKERNYRTILSSGYFRAAIYTVILYVVFTL